MAASWLLDSICCELETLKWLQAKRTGKLEALMPSIFDKAFRGEL